jgi:hypothetical protein
VLALVDLLGRRTADVRAAWINAAILLKMLGKGSDAYLDAFVQFSRKSPKFVSCEDCVKTWRSLRYVPPNAGRKKRLLTTRTLLKYARQDDPEGFRSWQKQTIKVVDLDDTRRRRKSRQRAERHDRARHPRDDRLR